MAVGLAQLIDVAGRPCDADDGPKQGLFIPAEGIGVSMVRMSIAMVFVTIDVVLVYYLLLRHRLQARTVKEKVGLMVTSVLLFGATVFIMEAVHRSLEERASTNQLTLSVVIFGFAMLSLWWTVNFGKR